MHGGMMPWTRLTQQNGLAVWLIAFDRLWRPAGPCEARGADHDGVRLPLPGQPGRFLQGCRARLLAPGVRHGRRVLHIPTGRSCNLDLPCAQPQSRNDCTCMLRQCTASKDEPDHP